MLNITKTWMKIRNKAYIAVILITIVVITVSLITKNKKNYVLENENKTVFERETFNVNIKKVSSEEQEEKISLKLGKKAIIEENILKAKNINYSFDRNKNILELESKDIKNGVEVPIVVSTTGKTIIELYEGDEKIDEEIVIIEESEENEVSTQIDINNTAIREVSTWAEFHAAFIDKTVTEINIISDFASTAVTNLYYMDAYRRPVGTNITINGNGHIVDLRGLIYSFQGTTTANYNTLTIRDLDIQGQSWWGPFLMEGNANTGASIIYENISYEGAQMTAAFIADIYIKGIVNSKSVSSYISKIDGKKYNTDAGNQQNLEVTNVIFTTNSVYNGYGENGPLMFLRNGGSAILQENSVVNLERDGDAGEHAYVTLYLEGNVDLEKNSKLNIKTRDGSKAGGMRLVGSGKHVRVKEGAELNVNTNGVVHTGTEYSGISVGGGAILDVEIGGKIDINMANMGTSPTNALYMGTGAIVNVNESGLLNITTTGAGTGITTAGSSELNINKRGNLNVTLENTSTSTRSGIVTGASSSLIVEEDGLLDVDVYGSGTGIKVGATSTFNIEGKGELNIDLHDTGTSTAPALDGAANTSIVVKKDGVLDIKSDGTVSKKLVDIAAGLSSNFRFSDAKRINLEFTEVPNSASKLIYMPYGYLSIDIQSVKSWDKNAISIDELTPTKSWTPIWTDAGMKTVEYDPLGATKKVSGSSVTQTLEDDFNTNFKTENYRKLLFEGIPDVSITIDGLLNTSRIVKGKTNPNAYVRFSGDPGLPKGDVPSPLDSEKNDPAKNYHVIADSTGNYNYSLPDENYLTNGNTVEAYSFLNGKDAVVSTLVENRIYIPDPNLRKVINSSLGRGLVSSPEYFTTEEMEIPTKLYYGDSAKADADKIVDLTGIEYATNLTEINFSFNKISDLAPLSNLSKLEVLYMNSNQITNLPDDFDSLLSLKNLYLTSNQIVGLPDSFSNLPNLITLYLHTNKITTLPSNFGNLKQLKTFYVYSNELTSLPDSIVDITNLDLLSIHHNKLTSLPDNIGDLTNLTKLYANDNQIPEIPSSFANLTKLSYLDISKNLLTNISQVTGITTLEDLIARNNQITDIYSLESLTGLVNVNLGFNKVSDLTPISNLEKLTSLDFTANNIKDIDALENIISLTSVSLGQNQISNITPLTNLIDMSILNLYQNKVSDISPLSDKSKLIYLILSYNNVIDISSLDKIIGGITTFDASNQTINLGTIKINGNILSLDNPAVTIEGKVPVTTVSDGGNYNPTDSTINWSNLKTTQSTNFTFKDGKRNFGGTVNLIISRIGIMNPDNPDTLNSNINPEGIVDFNHDFKLSINYIEPIDFGTVGIESRDMSIEAVTKTPYIQLTDLREVASGWKLNISATKLKETSGAFIEGVRIRFKNGEVKSSPIGNSLAPNIEEDIILTLGSTSSTIMVAYEGKGHGTWLGIWGTENTLNENIIMEIPDGKARAGAYETILTWELLDTP